MPPPSGLQRHFNYGMTSQQLLPAARGEVDTLIRPPWRAASALFPQLEPDRGGPEAAEELVEEGGGEEVAEAGREGVAGEDGAQRAEGDGDAEAVAGIAVEGAVDRVGRQAV